jgi:ribosomal protein S30
MKTTLKRKNDEFLVMPLKHVLSVMGHVNPQTPKLWAIAHKNGHKRKNNKFLVMHVKQVLSVMGLKITPKTPNYGL